MNRIAELRKKIGLSQSALGEILGVSQQTISKYEKSDLNVPADILAKMSRVFKVSIEYIEYYGAAEPPVRCGESHLSGLTEPPHFVY